MIQLSEQSEYAYAVGRIRSLEKRVMDRSTLIRLLEEPLPAVCRLLDDRGYPLSADTCGMPDDRDQSFISPVFADLKDNALRLAFDEVRSLSRDITITNLIPLRYDALNLALILKAQATKRPLPRLLTCGGITPDDLVRMVEDEGRNLPEPLLTGYRRREELGEDVEDVRIISCRILGAYWRHVLSMARSSKLPFLRLLVAHRIDGANLTSLIRLKLTGEETLSRLEEELVPGSPSVHDARPSEWEPIGFEPLDRSVFRRAWGEPLENLVNTLAGTRLARAAEAAISGSNGFEPNVFARELDILLLKLIRESRIATFGIEPLLAYMIEREIEITNVRIILAGRAVGLSAERIQEELRCIHG